MVYQLSDSDIRNICREKLEAAEYWLRRLVDDLLREAYGDYFGYSDHTGKRIIKKKIAEDIENRMRKEPDRYPRKVDAITLENLVDIVCHPELFRLHFSEPLRTAFPEGRDEARTFLTRLLEPRNRLSHANSISLRQAERVICYSGDVIDSLKLYYAEQGMQREYDVPLILKSVDSFGKVFFRDQMRPIDIGAKAVDLNRDSECYLYPGDRLTIEVEIDPAYDRSAYKIEWYLSQTPLAKISSHPKVVVDIEISHVSEIFNIVCRIISDKEWHRINGRCDDEVWFRYSVLPRI